jgi:hypothetical protein
MPKLSAGIGLSLLLPLVLSAATTVDPPDPRANGTFVTPVPGKPFTAVDRLEHTRIDQDGKVLSFKTTRDIARDSRGRIYKVARLPEPFTANGTPPTYMIELYDPQTRIYTLIYPRSKTFWKGDLDHTPSLLAQEYFYGRPMHDGLPIYRFAKEEDLGTQTMEDLPVHGIRETQTVVDGTGKSIAVTDEYWYSDDLRMSLAAKDNIPDGGSVTVTVTKLTETEPDPAIFEIPAGYKQRDKPED